MAKVTIFVGDGENEVLVVVGVMIVGEEAVEEAFVADGQVCTAVDVVIGVAGVSFDTACVVEVAGF